MFDGARRHGSTAPQELARYRDALRKTGLPRLSGEIGVRSRRDAPTVDSTDQRNIICSFVNFLVAIPLKFIFSRRMETSAESRGKLRSAVVTGRTIVSSALVGALLAKKYESAFHAQGQPLGQYLVGASSPLAAQATPGFLMFIGFWGMLHLCLSILFDVGVKMNSASGPPYNRRKTPRRWTVFLRVQAWIPSPSAPWRPRATGMSEPVFADRNTRY